MEPNETAEPKTEAPKTEAEEREIVAPLAYDASGREIEIAQAAAAWKVVRCQPGRPVAVLDPEMGGPLFVPLTTTAAELRAKTGGGRLKLIQVDADYLPIKDAAAAFIDLPPPDEPEATTARAAENPLAQPFSQVLDALAKSNEVTRASLDRVSTAFTEMGRTLGEALATLAKLASGQPIQPPVEVITEAPAPVGEQPDRVTPIVNLIKESLPMIMAAVASRAQAAQAQAGEQASQETTP